MHKMSLLILLGIVFLCPACSKGLSPTEKQTADSLRAEYARVQRDILTTSQEDSLYEGGLLKSLIGVRLEILKTNSALIQQRIHAIEGKAKINIVVNATKLDSIRASELKKDIESQRSKIAEARAEADRYSGGLVQAMAEVTVATERSTLAMLQQQYIIARYGLSLPVAVARDEQVEKHAGASSQETQERKPTPSQEPREKPTSCLEIETYDSSVLSTNDVYTELAWKVDIKNSCAQPFQVRVTFTIYDKDEFELDSDDEVVLVPANGIGKARGKMLISPPEKAARMAKQGVSMSLR